MTTQKMCLNQHLITGPVHYDLSNGEAGGGAGGGERKR